MISSPLVRPRREAGSGRLAFDVRRVYRRRAARDAQHLLFLHASVRPNHPQEHVVRARRGGAHAGVDNEPGVCLGVPGNVRRQVAARAWAQCSEHELGAGWPPLGIEEASCGGRSTPPAPRSARHSSTPRAIRTSGHPAPRRRWPRGTGVPPRSRGPWASSEARAAGIAATRRRTNASAGMPARRRPRKINNMSPHQSVVRARSARSIVRRGNRDDKTHREPADRDLDLRPVLIELRRPGRDRDAASALPVAPSASGAARHRPP